MMTIFSDRGGRPCLIIGLTEANRARLPGHPITLQGPHPVAVQDIMIVHGADKLDIMAQLQEAGLEFAQVMQDAIRRDPT
jgi:hypothetical protein